MPITLRCTEQRFNSDIEGTVLPSCGITTSSRTAALSLDSSLKLNQVSAFFGPMISRRSYDGIELQ